jgi:general secretion pathway protein E
MSRLDIAEKRLPQDGRISLRIAGRAVDVRVSTIPAGHGERVVLRLLDKQAGRLDLHSLGMDSVTQHNVDELIHKPNGILLVTGPPVPARRRRSTPRSIGSTIARATS